LTALLATNARALWYLTRGFGLVSLILLTVTMVLGLTQAVRYARAGWPRFVLSALHRNAALLAVVAVGVHVATSVLDSYVSIRVADVFLPFISAYRPIWLGLGALAIDLMVALVITSLLRERLGYRAWRVVHWAAFACWPVAVIHGLGTGSDTRLRWVQMVYVACVVAVVGSVWWRLARVWSRASAGERGAALAASVVLPVAVAAWTVTGPLQTGWARRSGTPAALVGAQTSAPTAAGSAAAPTIGTKGGWVLPFTSRFRGAQHQTGPDSNGAISVTIAGTLTAPESGRLAIVLTGQPAEGGGVELTASQVTLGPPGAPSEYRGPVTRLQGSTVVASLSSAAGSTVTATMVLQLDGPDGTVTGTVEVAR
jgi:sulfoxide reductase heme-binding subunit YedZ